MTPLPLVAPARISFAAWLQSKAEFYDAGAKFFIAGESHDDCAQDAAIARALAALVEQCEQCGCIATRDAEACPSCIAIAKGFAVAVPPAAEAAE